MGDDELCRLHLRFLNVVSGVAGDEFRGGVVVGDEFRCRGCQRCSCLVLFCCFGVDSLPNDQHGWSLSIRMVMIVRRKPGCRSQ